MIGGGEEGELGALTMTVVMMMMMVCGNDDDDDNDALSGWLVFMADAMQ